MRKILMPMGMFALVDDEDFEMLNRYRWCATKRSNTFYAERGSKVGGRYCNYKMHRVVMSAPSGMVVDHLNHNGLDNRKSNLRIATYRENNQNRSVHGSSMFPGVYLHSDNQNWISQIRVSGRTIHLGVFDCEEDAKKQYERACQDLDAGKEIQPKRSRLTSQYKGVYWHKADAKWVVRIQKDKKRYSLGRFNVEAEAATQYDRKAIELFGDFACLNFPEIETVVAE